MIIGVGFNKRVGKDEFCKIAIRRFPNVKITRLAFADELKLYIFESILRPMGYSINCFEDQEFYSKLRPVVQAIGMFYRDAVDTEWWIKKVAEKIRDDSISIITDVRLKNERDWVKSQGGIMIRVNRNTGEQDFHISENELNDDKYFDIIIDNNGTLREYEEKVVTVFSDFLGTPKRNKSHCSEV